MADTRQLAFRFSLELIDRLDRHVERLRAAAPWSNPNRATAVRVLLTTALDAAEKATAKPRARTARTRSLNSA